MRVSAPVTYSTSATETRSGVANVMPSEISNSASEARREARARQDHAAPRLRRFLLDRLPPPQRNAERHRIHNDDDRNRDVDEHTTTPNSKFPTSKEPERCDNELLGNWKLDVGS